MKLNKNQLSVVKSIIKEEIEKFQKKVLTEGKKKKLMKELEMLNENDGSKRLSKVAMELNMSIDSVAKELTKLTGLEMEPNPNLKISPEFYELLTQKPNFEEIGEISIENGFVNFLPLGNYGKRMSLTSRADIVGLLNGEGGKKGDVEFESYYDNFGKHGIDGKEKFVQYITDALKSAGFKLRDIGDFEQAQELYKLFAPQKKRFEDNLWNEEIEMPKGVNESGKKKTKKKQITISELKQIIKESIESLDKQVLKEKAEAHTFDNFRDLIETFKSAYPSYYNAYEQKSPGFFEELIQAVESDVNLQKWAESYTIGKEDKLKFHSRTIFFKDLVGVWSFFPKTVEFGVSSSGIISWRGEINSGELVIGLGTFNSGSFDPTTVPL